MAGNKSLQEDYQKLNEKVEKEILAIRNELKDCVGMINSSSKNLDLKLSGALDEMASKNELLNKKLTENSTLMHEEMKKICNDYEVKLQGIKAEFETKREELLSHVDKNIQTISSEIKKIKLS